MHERSEHSLELAYAHSLAGRPVAEWEPLEEHLRQVAALASEFAGAFGAREWGELAGLWHDLGKYSAAFQTYLREQNGLEAAEASLENAGQRPRHAVAGARVAHEAGKGGLVLAYCIAGHHGGLNDTEDLRSRLCNGPVIGMPTTLPLFAQKQLPAMPALRLAIRPEQNAFQIGCLVRMLFSALVDADFLATERFMSPDQARSRERPPVDRRRLQKGFADVWT